MPVFIVEVLWSTENVPVLWWRSGPLNMWLLTDGENRLNKTDSEVWVSGEITWYAGVHRRTGRHVQTDIDSCVQRLTRHRPFEKSLDVIRQQKPWNIWTNIQENISINSPLSCEHKSLFIYLLLKHRPDGNSQDGLSILKHGQVYRRATWIRSLRSKPSVFHLWIHLWAANTVNQYRTLLICNTSG